MTIALSGQELRKPRTGWSGRIIRYTLHVPLVAKLIGANVIIVAAAIAVQTLVFGGRDHAEIVAVVVALSAASIVNFLLVRIALRPVDELELLAERVSAGQFGARSVRSPVADPALARLGATVNSLLDSLAAERKRIQDLGAEVVYAQDAERARVSRELHDSIAQTLAAVRFQLAVAGTEATGDLRNRIAAANGLVGAAMEEVRNVSYSLHPRVAEDLGLEAALETLARQVQARSGVEVNIVTFVGVPSIPANISGTLYRVAQEALRNIEMHSRAKSATVEVMATDGSVRIEVRDDGRGFDPAAIRAPAFRTGLASVHDRVTLAGGVMTIDSVPNGGTRVIAELQAMKVAS